MMLGVERLVLQQATTSVLIAEWSLQSGRPTTWASFSAQGETLVNSCQSRIQWFIIASDALPATEAWGRTSARSSTWSWTSGRTVRWPGWKRWAWIWRCRKRWIKVLDLKLIWSEHIEMARLGTSMQNWSMSSGCLQATERLTVQRLRYFSHHQDLRFNIVISWFLFISDSSWAVDLCQIWPWGVYPPWEAELHLRIHGGLHLITTHWEHTHWKQH